MPEARRSRRGGVVAVLTLAVAGVAGAGFLLTQDRPAADSSVTGAQAAPVAVGHPPKVVVSPPPVDPRDVATDTAVPASAAVQITYAGVDDAAGGVSVGAYVAGLIEEGGRCTLTLSLDGASATSESESVADARTTSCGELIVPVADLSPGTWTADVAYASPRGSAVTAARTSVEVQ
ncbi:MAG: hypothetical protein ACLGI3_20255 [Actinomycetes bacterium]